MNSRKIILTAGNLRNGHIYLREHQDFFPKEAFGGANRAQAGSAITVRFDPGQTVETDIDGAKVILRARGATRDFFERAGARAGDAVAITRTGARAYTVSLAPGSEA